jgi:PKD repeat protein
MKKLLLTLIAILATHMMYATCTSSFTYASTSTPLQVQFTNASTYGTIPGGYTASTYIYFGTSGTPTYMGSYSGSTITNTYAAPGTYGVSVVVKIHDSLGTTVSCYDSSTQYVTVSYSACASSFTDSLMSGTTYSFHSTMLGSGTGVSYSWNFGDGSALGTGSNPTHTYPTGAATYTVTLTTTTTSPSCSSTSTSTVTIGSSSCASSFTDSLLSGTTYSFYSYMSGGGTGVSYSWDFGDGSALGTGSAPTHTYPTGAATYTVTLTTTTTSPVCSSTSTGTIVISGGGSANKIMGTIYKNASIAPTSADYMVWLIHYDSLTHLLTAVDSLTITGAGATAAYQFLGEPSSDYFVKAAITNGPTSGSGYTPTYHDSSFYWYNANNVHHVGGTVAGVNIHMLMGTVTSGPGFIAGNVMTGANKSANKVTSGIPAVGLNIYLISCATSGIVSHTVTDASGNYSFSSLPLGTYNVFPENMNDTTTAWTNIILTSTSTSANNISFIEHTISMTITPVGSSGISNTVNNNSLVIYPNPTNGNITVQWGNNTIQNGKVSITNLIGQKVLETQLNTRNVTNNTINLSQLQAGIYFITIDADNIHEVQKLVLNH